MAFSIILLASFAVIPSAGHAQSRAQKSIITQLLWQSLLQCYVAPVERVGANDEVILRVQLNTNGDISNLPEILNPTRLTTGERGLLREGTAALIDCTPIVSSGGERSIYGKFDIVLNRAGLSLTNVEANVGEADGIPTLESLEVSEPVDEPVLVEVTETETKSDEVPAEPEAPEPTSPQNTDLQERATIEVENTLELTKTDRREIQRRLSLLDYNTRGIDGVFGNGTRTAIRQWQRDSDVPSSGYLNAGQIDLLREMSADEYATWNARPKRYTDRNGCLREPNGVIVQGRSFKCDLAAASQSIGISR